MTKTAENLTSALSSSTRKYGKALVTSIFVTTKVSKLYGYEHQNFEDGITGFLKVVNFFVRNEGSTTLAVVNEFLVLNETSLKIDLGGYQSYRHVVDILREREVGEVVFHDGVERAELIRFIRLLNQTANEDDPWAGFSQAFQRANLEHVEVSKIEITAESELSVDPDARQAAIHAYYRTMDATSEAQEAFKEGARWNPKRLKRSAQNIVDLVMSEESTILALTSMNHGASPAVNHATNCTILSAALGAKIGLPKRTLGDLAFASLMHDVGKVELPDGPDPKCAHALEGARKLLLSGRVSNSVIRAMNVALLHHRAYGGGGSPSLSVDIDPCLLTGIVSVCNTYDRYVIGTSGGADPLLPAEALSKVIELGGKTLDPLLVRVFVNLMGLFPVGSLVRLDSGELATVTRSNPKSELLHRPYVRVFSSASGENCDLFADLSELTGGEFKRSIVGSFHPEEIELDLGEYLSVI